MILTSLPRNFFSQGEAWSQNIALSSGFIPTSQKSAFCFLVEILEATCLLKLWLSLHLLVYQRWSQPVRAKMTARVGDTQAIAALKQNTCYTNTIHKPEPTDFWWKLVCINSLCMSTRRSKLGNKVKIMVPNLNIIKSQPYYLQPLYNSYTRRRENVNVWYLNELMSSLLNQTARSDASALKL